MCSHSDYVFCVIGGTAAKHGALKVVFRCVSTNWLFVFHTFVFGLYLFHIFVYLEEG